MGWPVGMLLKKNFNWVEEEIFTLNVGGNYFTDYILDIEKGGV